MKRTYLPGTSSSPTAHSEPQFKHFLDLPAEIRIKIYDMVLELLGNEIRPRTLLTSHNWHEVTLFPGGAELFLVNKQVSAESRFRFYSNKRFIFWMDEYYGHDDPEYQEKALWRSPMLNCRRYAAPKPQGLGLLRVNRQISTEAASRLYGINTFIFSAYMYFEEEGPVGTNVTENSYLLSWLRQVGHNALHVQRIEVEINPLDPEDVDVAMVELTALTPLVPNLRFLTLYYVPDEDEIHMRSSTRDAWLTIPWSQDLIRKLRKFLDAEFRQVEVVRLKHHLPMDSETDKQQHLFISFGDP
ncbi:hypothetical protein VTJ04DRAFT_10360 [Mycothermus thermophilus]|uniref:uncharacterized protein n=1 Tax=Humicola insolens TaxID=85995 RepID=UPI003743DABB